MSKSDDAASKQQFNLRKAWNKAHVANLMAVTNPQETEPFGAFAIGEDLQQIFSRLPREDYEVGDANIRQWKMLFMPDEQRVIMSDYFNFLSELGPYILDEQNNSILLRAMSSEEILAIFERLGYDTISGDQSIAQE